MDREAVTPSVAFSEMVSKTARKISLSDQYELIDGELRDMEQTGLHEAVAGNVAGRIYVEIFQSRLNWLVPKTCLIKPLTAEATAYWIVDFRGLGGLQFIGNPKQPTLTICQLIHGVYQQQQYRLRESITSYLFPNLNLKLDDLMPT